jgi:hypothetical protein
LSATLFSQEYRQDLLAGARLGNVVEQTKTWSLILLNRWADRWM